MTGFTDRYAAEALNSLIAEYPYVALFTGVGTDAGTGFTEVSGGSYARFATGSGDWASPSGSAPVSMANNFTMTFTQASADWGTVIAWGLYDAPTVGNLGLWDYLGNFSWLPATVSSASPGVITAKAHGISVADTIVFTTEYGGTSPTFSQSNFTGLLVLAHSATDTLDVTNSATQVNTSSTGSGMIRKVASQAIASGVTASFAAGAITITAA
jgi:hypothetical protein